MGAEPPKEIGYQIDEIGYQIDEFIGYFIL